MSWYRTQTLLKLIAEAGEDPVQPVVAAAPAPGLDAGDFFGYLKSWWESTVYPKYKTDGGSASCSVEFWMETLKSGFLPLVQLKQISPMENHSFLRTKRT